jgi:hypothetical protein
MYMDSVCTYMRHIKATMNYPTTKPRERPEKGRTPLLKPECERKAGSQAVQQGRSRKIPGPHRASCSFIFPWYFFK